MCLIHLLLFSCTNDKQRWDRFVTLVQIIKPLNIQKFSEAGSTGFVKSCSCGVVESTSIGFALIYLELHGEGEACLSAVGHIIGHRDDSTLEGTSIDTVADISKSGVGADCTSPVYSEGGD